MEGETVQIQIKKDLYQKAEKYIKDVGGFDSVDELIEFLLQEILQSETPTTGNYSAEEEEKVKERLRSLGYL